MAVNAADKEAVLQNRPPTGKVANQRVNLRAERQRFDRFVGGLRLVKDAATGLALTTDAQWRDYVRQSHHLRSGELIRAYFDTIDLGVGEAIARVCEGHGLDFAELEQIEKYPSDFSALRETVNLRALATYVRLVDLLDFGRDRTPYVIWKFVAPRDPRSMMEWEKHQALGSVTCPPYQTGRVIQVDGQTTDHEVYAASGRFEALL